MNPELAGWPNFKGLVGHGESKGQFTAQATYGRQLQCGSYAERGAAAGCGCWRAARASPGQGDTRAAVKSVTVSQSIIQVNGGVAAGRQPGSANNMNPELAGWPKGLADHGGSRGKSAARTAQGQRRLSCLRAEGAARRGGRAARVLPGQGDTRAATKSVSQSVRSVGGVTGRQGRQERPQHNLDTDELSNQHGSGRPAPFNCYI